MYDSAQTIDLPQVVAVEPIWRGQPVLAWIVILLLAGFVVVRQREEPAAPGKAASDGMASRITLIQFQYLVAAANLLGGQHPQLAQQLDAFKVETSADRIRLAIVAGEILGPEQAQQRLSAFKDQQAQVAAQGLIVGGATQLLLSDAMAASKATVHVEILERLYYDYQQQEFTGPSLEEAERQLLRTELGWFGELALPPATGPDEAARAAVLQPAFRVFGGIIGVVAVLGVVSLAGLIGLTVFAILFLTRKIAPLLTTSTGHGGVYAETFALWLVLFLGLSLAFSVLPLPRLGLLNTALTMLGSLAALVWPVLRGIPWRQVREDIGLTAGRSPFLEPFLGLGAYAMALPLVILGTIITALLLHSSFGQAERMPSHPIAEQIPALDWWGRIQILILACVLAPLVEEIVFRGLLYRHLREATVRWGHVASVLASAVVVSFLFAVIHPQGLLGVPLLMALAFAFTLVREWRGTLVPSMVAHAVTNGLSLLGVLLLYGD